jgi:uncharacterized protein with gpF-like domain
MHWLDKGKSVAELKLIKGFQKDMHKEFMRQYRATMKMLAGQDAFTELYQYAQEKHPDIYEKKATRKDVKKVDAYFYDWDKKVKAQEGTEEVVNKWILKAGQLGGQRELKKLGVGLSFNLKNKEVIKGLLERGKKITGEIAERTLDDFRRTMVNSYMEVGMSPYEVRDRIGGMFEETYKNRAFTIARTETAVAQGVAARETDERNGITKKKWMAHIDGRTRYSHRNLDGTVIPMDKKFRAEDEKGRVAYLDWAHDPSAPAREVVNCRCDVEGVVDLRKPFEAKWTGQ